MDGAVWFITVFLCVITVSLFALTFVPFFARWSAYRHAVVVGIDLPERLERAVSARLMARGRGAVLGALVFTVAAALAVYFEIGVRSDSNLTVWFIAGAAIAGGGTGAAIAAFTGSPSIAPDQPRIARSEAVSVADYIHPFERFGARVFVTAAVLVVAADTVLDGSDAGNPIFPVALFAVFGVIALAVFEVVSRRIVALPQPAGSTAELVWDDVIRTSTLRDMLSAPFALGAFSVLFGLLGLVDTLPNTMAAADVTGLATTAAMLALVLYSSSTRPQRYFLDRLWPNLRWSDTADIATDAV